MKFDLEEVTVYFPYEFIYPEQYKYMQELKRALDAPGHCLLEARFPARCCIAHINALNESIWRVPCQLCLVSGRIGDWSAGNCMLLLLAVFHHAAHIGQLHGKRSLPLCLQMPTGTGKTITLLSLVTAYQRAHPELGKLIYCTRTVPEMEKVLVELRELIEYRERYITGSSGQILAVGLSSRKNLCIHKGVQGATELPQHGCETSPRIHEPVPSMKLCPMLPDRADRSSTVVRLAWCTSPATGSLCTCSQHARESAPATRALLFTDEATRESVDAKCRKLTAPWVRERALAAGGGRQTGTQAPASTSAGPSAGPSAAAADGDSAEAPAVRDIEDVEVCGFFEGHSAAGNDAVLPPGVYTLHDLRQFGRKKGWCPYYLARHMVSYANVVVWSYQYLIDPKVSQMVRRRLPRRSEHCRPGTA